jgi:hypothetical protein
MIPVSVVYLINRGGENDRKLGEDFMKFQSVFAGRAAAALAAVLILAGCEVDSPDGTARDVNITVQGLYRNDGSPVVADNTGNPITSLNVLQAGDQLEAVDNNGMVFRGTIGRVQGGSPVRASFTLEGLTTAGQEGTMVGTFEVSGTDSSLSGTWAEPSRLSTVHGRATVPTVQTNSPGTNSAALFQL